MPLTECPDCGSQVSDLAPQCPKCGRPIAGDPAIAGDPDLVKVSHGFKHDQGKGAWCPKCGNRDSYKETKAGCFYWIIVLFLALLPLLFYPFLPRVWHCRICKNEWRA